MSAAPRRGTPYGQRTRNGTFATTTYWTPGTFPNPMAPWTLNYYLPEEITQVKGKTIMFQADFTIRDFADAVDFYCGVRPSCVCMCVNNVCAWGVGGAPVRCQGACLSRNCDAPVESAELNQSTATRSSIPIDDSSRTKTPRSSRPPSALRASASATSAPPRAGSSGACQRSARLTG